MNFQKKLQSLKKYFTRKTSCPYCNSNSQKVINNYKIYKVVECNKCKTIYINPYLSEEGVNKAYNEYSNLKIRKTGNEFKNRQKMYKQDYKLLSNFINEKISKKILDIGGSDGKFISLFSNKNEKYIAEIDRSSFKSNKKINYKSFNGYKLPYKKNHFEVVILRGVLEHILKPNLLLNDIKRVLKKNGVLFITATPDRDSFAFYVYNNYWNQFNPIYHYTYVSSKFLNKILNTKGFENLILTHPYLSTPYENYIYDYKKIVKDIRSKKITSKSPPFFGTMFTGIWKLS